MGKYIVKINDKYFEWSTVVDAPVTFGMNLGELGEYIIQQQGKSGFDVLPERLIRVEITGISAHDRTLEDLIEGNRAGKNEEELSKNDLYDVYKSYENYKRYFEEEKE